MNEEKKNGVRCSTCGGHGWIYFIEGLLPMYACDRCNSDKKIPLPKEGKTT